MLVKLTIDVLFAATIAILIVCVIFAGGTDLLVVLGFSEDTAQALGKPFPALPFMAAMFLAMIRLAAQDKGTALGKYCAR